MRRSIPFAAIAWLILTPLLAHADRPNRAPRPTVFLRSTGQFIAQSAEREATLYDLQGQALRVFASPTDIDKIELSSDEKYVLLMGKKDGVFDIATGAVVSEPTFVPVVEPPKPVYRYVEIRDPDDPRLSNLELLDASTGWKARRLGSFNRIFPAVWLATGEADVPVVKEQEGQESVGFFRLDPKSGSFTELLWCPVGAEGSFMFVDRLAFDPERGIGVKTSRTFVTQIIDLHTGFTLLTIDNSANYISPYKHLWDTPLGDLTNGELVFALLVLGVLLLGVFQSLRFIWNFVIHMATHWPLPPPSQEAKDYGE